MARPAKYNIQDLASFAITKNGKCLSSVYISTLNKYTWQCENNHIFEAQWGEVVRGAWCKQCSITNRKDTIQDLKNKAEKLQFECLKGHKFQRSIKQFEKNSKCSTCEGSTKSSDYLHRTSRGEKDLLSFVKQYYPSADKIKVNDIFDKTELNNAEFDIYIPELKLAIEYNGLFYHSDALDENHRRVNTSQYRKYKFCTSNGIRLINIFEDEWKLRQKQTENFLLSVLNIHDVRIGASKCKIKQLSKKEAVDFINENHIQEVHNLKIAFGLFYKNNLIGVVAGANHHRINNHKYLVLSRMCFKYKTQIIGGASRLLNALIQYSKEHGYTGIISWSDNRLSTGDVYKKIGFTLEKELPPDYYYIRSGNIEKINKSKFRVLAGINERTYNREQGYYQLWDCGKKTWLLPHL